MRRLGWIVVAALATVALLFAADSVLRSYAEQRMKDEITRALPADVSVPGLRVDVRGFSFIAQYLGGTFTRVDVDAPAIDTSRGALSVSLTAADVRIDPSFATPPVLGTVHGTLDVSESSVNSLVALPDPSASIRLSEKTVTYTATTQVLGLPISYAAAVRPVADGTVVRLYPLSVNVTSGPVHFDVKSLLGGVFDGKPINVCIAPYIPAGLAVGDITVAQSRATIQFEASAFSLAERTFMTHAACPAS